jgi:hypothetical protein
MRGFEVSQMNKFSKHFNYFLTGITIAALVVVIANVIFGDL